MRKIITTEKPLLATPKVSITIPVYNLRDLVVRALDSIPRRHDLEIIVCDDASTDGTWEVLERYVAEHPDLNIKLLRNDTNRGVGYTRNRLLDACTGLYVTGLDADDQYITDAWEDAMCHITDEDIVYIDGITNNGWYVGLNETTKLMFGAIWDKFIKRSFLNNSRCPEISFAEDKALNEALQAKPHTDRFTHILAYRYNHPREGSLCWIENHKK